MADRLLSPDEAADFLGVQKSTLAVWRCVQRYPLPFVRIGRLIRYRQTDLEAFVQENTVRSGNENDEQDPSRA